MTIKLITPQGTITENFDSLPSKGDSIVIDDVSYIVMSATWNKNGDRYEPIVMVY
jgi:hypothetical protein